MSSNLNQCADAEAYRTWVEFGRNGVKASQHLGLARTTFRARIKRYEEHLAALAAHEAQMACPECGNPRSAHAGARFCTASRDEVATPGDGVCKCGCGAAVARSFIPGHDSRYASLLRAAYVSGRMTRDEVLATAAGVSERFHGKLVRSLAHADEAAAPGDGKCRCGCGITVGRNFAPGHDSKYAKLLRSAHGAGRMTRDEVLAAAMAVSDPFHGKLVRSLGPATLADADA